MPDGRVCPPAAAPRHRSPWGQPGHPGGDGEGREQPGPRAQRAWTHVPPCSAGACFEPATSETLEQSEKGQEKTEPGSGAKEKEKAREEQEEKAGGCQEPETGFNPQPRCPETSAPARGEQRSFCAGPARKHGGGGEACEVPAPHRPALVPPYKGDGGPWRGGRGCRARGAALPGLSGARQWLCTGPVSQAGLRRGCGRCCAGWGVWTAASAGRELKQSRGPKANAARRTGRSQTPGVCSVAA